MNKLTPNEENFSPFFNCEFFKDYLFSLNEEDFTVEQGELKLLSSEEDEETGKQQVNFGQVNTTYSCSFFKSENLSDDKPLLLLCIKDNVKLLEYTLNNFSEFKIDQHANVLIIDDRPSDNTIKDLTLSRSYSYLKVSYEEDFNFSLINNIAAKIAHKVGCKEIILWNSDMWAHDETTFPELIRLHRENEAEISGTKLVYPPFRWDNDESKEGAGVAAYFQPKLQTYRGTTQFGGIYFMFGDWGSFVPNHSYRFINPNHPLVNCDKGELCVTGAFQIIKLDWFIENGGFNPSLPRIFQDIDLCLRADRVFYLGKDRYFYHDESLLTLNEESNDQQMVSDNLLFAKIWPPQKFIDRTIVINN